ncbi:MAG: DUF4157 domain-containing protein [Nevskia sp.]|nr:DUF4157 domain-containing protein [Nevskia sp.]
MLQRQCACGAHTPGGASCGECASGGTLQRSAHGQVGAASAPPIVHDALRSPGQPLDASTRALMEPRLGRDLSQVRVHTDELAAQSARAVNASAYTVSPHVVFGAGRYAPGTAQGLQLLGHELTHVAQQEPLPAAGGALRVEPAGTPAEQEADRVSHQIAAGSGGEVQQRQAGGVLNRSLDWAVGGGVAGGAVLGGALGAGLGKVSTGAGIAGGVLGGIAGFLGGAVLGDYLSTDRRKLTPAEQHYAHDIFLESLDYDAIDITKNSTLARGTSRTFKNTINLQDRWFKPNSMDLTDQGQEVLVHEMGHVWQYQHGGYTYIPSSLIPQAIAGDRGTRNLAYNWRDAANNRLPFQNWNAEQQAECISDYNEALRRINNPPAAAPGGDPPSLLKDYNTVSLADPYIKLVQQGKGAVGSKPEPAPGGAAP